MRQHSANQYQESVSSPMSLPPPNRSTTDKDKWIEKERLRWASVFNIPMKKEVPEGFPPMTLTIMRALCALTVLNPGKEGQPKLIKALDALFHAFWVEHKKTNEKEVLVAVLNEVLGKEEAGKVMGMVPKEGKEVLNKNTDKALADGAFGSGNHQVVWNGTDSKGMKVSSGVYIYKLSAGTKVLRLKTIMGK